MRASYRGSPSGDLGESDACSATLRRSESSRRDGPRHPSPLLFDVLQDRFLDVARCDVARSGHKDMLRRPRIPRGIVGMIPSPLIGSLLKVTRSACSVELTTTQTSRLASTSRERMRPNCLSGLSVERC